MRLECPKRVLEETIGTAERITGKNLTLPVLKCVHLAASGKVLTVRATNLDLGIEIKTPVKADKDGEAAVPGGVLHSYIASLPADTTVSIETVGDNIKVSTENSSTLIKTLPHDDFPIIPKVEDGESFVLSAPDFIRGLKSVWWSAAISSMKPELSSVYIHSEGEGSLLFVATDSFRLAEKRVATEVPKGFGNILIPVKNIPEILRVLDGAKGDVEVTASKNQISFSFDNIYLVSRVVDGVFPDYKQIIPKDFKTESIVLKQDLVNNLKIAGIFSDKFNQINFKVDPKAKMFELTTRNSDVGESVNKLDASTSGEGIEINVVQRYVSESFQSVDSDSISIQFNGPGRPLVIRGVSDKSFTYLVMPMNK